MGATAGQNEYQQVSFPGSFPNRKSLLGLIPAMMLVLLGASGLQTDAWSAVFSTIGPIWLVLGLALGVASVAGYRAVGVDERSREASIVMLSWAIADTLLVLSFALGSELPHDTWFAIALACITVPLMQLGVMFIVWDAMEGAFGAFAKAIASALGCGALVAAGVLSVLMILEGFVAT